MDGAHWHDRARRTTWRTIHWGIGVCAVSVLALALAACGASRYSTGEAASPTQQSAADKLAKLQQIAAQETADAQLPHAPKQTNTPGPPILSCPIPTPEPGIFVPISLPIPGGEDAFLSSDTATIPADQPQYEYHIFAGEHRSNPQQGLLIVVRQNADPCAFGTPPELFPQGDYDTPLAQGRVQLTGVDGDTVTFTTAAGGAGRFNFETGQFS